MTTPDESKKDVEEKHRRSSAVFSRKALKQIQGPESKGIQDRQKAIISKKFVQKEIDSEKLFNTIKKVPKK